MLRGIWWTEQIFADSQRSSEYCLSNVTFVCDQFSLAWLFRSVGGVGRGAHWATGNKRLLQSKCHGIHFRPQTLPFFLVHERNTLAPLFESRLMLIPDYKLTQVFNNRQGSPGRDIFIENSLAFLSWSRNRFFPIQILIISPLRNARRDAQITTLTQRSRPVSLIELGYLCLNNWALETSLAFSERPIRILTVWPLAPCSSSFSSVSSGSLSESLELK